MLEVLRVWLQDSNLLGSHRWHHTVVSDRGVRGKTTQKSAPECEQLGGRPPAFYGSICSRAHLYVPLQELSDFPGPWEALQLFCGAGQRRISRHLQICHEA